MNYPDGVGKIGLYANTRFFKCRRIVEQSFAWRAIENGERFAAFLLLVALAPLLAAIGAAVALLSRKAPLVAHRRVGRFGKDLWLLKFRTMWERQPPRGMRPRLVELLGESEVPEFKIHIDPRVTSSFAAFCRKYSLDELPQLWQICCGEMSFVGPRPLTAVELSKHYGDNVYEVLKLKPGLSGLWQVLGRNRLTYRQRRLLDLWLVRRFSPSLYFAILMRTPAEVLRGRNAA